jgi:UPF0271 protein
MNKKVIVLDTSAFIAGFDPFAVQEKQYAVPEVGKELAAGSMPWTRLKAAVENGKLTVRRPKYSFTQEILEASRIVGDKRYLSEADLQVLALALELKAVGLTPLVVTDDYSIQNVANKIDVEFTSLLTFGIKFRFKWILYCPACYRKYSPEYERETCKVCGTPLKRKPKKRTAI